MGGPDKHSKNDYTARILFPPANDSNAMIPKRFFMELHSLFIKFVWGGKKPRLAMTMLHRSKLRGGLGIPNIFQYYQAIALQCILNWKFHIPFKLTVHSLKMWDRMNVHLTLAPWTSPLAPIGG